MSVEPMTFADVLRKAKTHPIKRMTVRRDVAEAITLPIINAVVVALGVSADDVEVDDERVTVEIHEPITLAMMQQLATALGTDRINIDPAVPETKWSEQTWEGGEPAKLVVLLGNGDAGDRA